MLLVELLSPLAADDYLQESVGSLERFRLAATHPLAFVAYALVLAVVVYSIHARATLGALRVVLREGKDLTPVRLKEVRLWFKPDVERVPPETRYPLLRNRQILVAFLGTLIAALIISGLVAHTFSLDEGSLRRTLSRVDDLLNQRSVDIVELSKDLAAVRSVNLMVVARGAELVVNPDERDRQRQLKRTVDELLADPTSKAMNPWTRALLVTASATLANAADDHREVLRLMSDPAIDDEVALFLELCRVRGEANFASQAWSEAASDYGVICSLAKDDSTRCFAQWRVASCLAKMNNPAAAIPRLRSVTEHCLNAEGTWMLRGLIGHELSVCLAQVGDYNAALQTVEAVLAAYAEHEPRPGDDRAGLAIEFPRLMNTRGSCLASLGRYADALTSFEDALSRLAQTSQGTAADKLGTLKNKAMCLESLGRHAEAVAVLTGAVDIANAVLEGREDKATSETLCLLYLLRGDAYENLGKQNAAQADFAELGRLAKRLGYDIEGEDVATIREALSKKG